MEYETQCGGCIYYDFQGDNYKGHCSYYGSYYYPGDSCSHQKPRESSSSSCYITTIVCNLMGKDDNCDVLNTLRSFRGSFLQKDEKYAKILYEYDTVGPIIASNLNEQFSKMDRNNKEFDKVEYLYNYLGAVANLIKNKEYDFAVSKYEELTLSLKDYYGIKYVDDIKDDYLFEKGGHGKVYKKEKATR